LKEKIGETEILERIRETLEKSVDTIDTETQYRLTQARKSALSPGRRQRFNLWPSFRLSFAILCAATVVLVFTIWYQPSPTVQPVISGIEDVEILANTDSLEFFAEIDFYFWLAEEVDHSG
jgi:hypothetical protein